MRPFFYDLSVEGSSLKVTVFGKIERNETLTLCQAIEAKITNQIKQITFDLTNVDKMNSHFPAFLHRLKTAFGSQGTVAINHTNDFIRKALSLAGFEKELLASRDEDICLIKHPLIRRFVAAHFDNLISKQIALIAYANRGIDMKAGDFARLMNKSSSRILPCLKSLAKSKLLVAEQKGDGDLYRFTDEKMVVFDFIQFMSALSDPNQRRLVRMQIHLNWQQKKMVSGIDRD